MKQPNHIPSLLTLTLICALICTACASDKHPTLITADSVASATADTVIAETTDTEPSTDTDAVTDSDTEAVTDAMTEAMTESVTEAVTEEVSVTYPTAISDDGKSTLAISPTPEGVYINPLTGLACTKEQATLRPVAIMLNNIKTALPQQNISYADILYECEVEGGLTRLLGIYNQYADLTAIGSVRSAREYYLDFAANHNAIFVHAGGSDSAYANLKSRKVNNIDGVNGGAVTGYFYRDPYRRYTLGMSLEHTLVIDGAKLNEAIAYKKYSQSYSADYTNPMHFVGYEQTLTLEGGRDAQTVNVSFSANRVQFVYDATTGQYMRYQNGEKHIDGTTGTQLGFENLVVVCVTYTKTGDDKNHITVNDVGTGTAFYFTGGKYRTVTWSKPTADSPMTLTYANGREVYFTPGKTCFEMINGTGNVTLG